MSEVKGIWLLFDCRNLLAIWIMSRFLLVDFMVDSVLEKKLLKTYSFIQIICIRLEYLIL